MHEFKGLSHFRSTICYFESHANVVRPNRGYTVNIATQNSSFSQTEKSLKRLKTKKPRSAVEAKYLTSYQPDPVALFRRRLHTQDRISNMPNAPRTVKDVPAQEFVIALAQYFRSTGKVRLASAITRVPVDFSGRKATGSAGLDRRDEATRGDDARANSTGRFAVSLSERRSRRDAIRVAASSRAVALPRSHHRVFFRVCGQDRVFRAQLARVCRRARIAGDRTR